MSPSLTAWPSSTAISLTMPASSASTGISIFIDSRITTVSPSSTLSPGRDLDLPDGAGDVSVDVGQFFPPGREYGPRRQNTRRASRTGQAPDRFRSDDPRDRPGDHGHDLHRVRRRRAAGWALLSRVHAALPAAGMGRARRRRDLGGVAGGRARGAHDGGHRRRRPARDRASRTSARPSCAWDRATGEPLHRAIVWQDRRTAERCDELRRAGHEARCASAPAS